MSFRADLLELVNRWREDHEENPVKDYDISALLIDPPPVPSLSFGDRLRDWLMKTANTVAVYGPACPQLEAIAAMIDADAAAAGERLWYIHQRRLANLRTMIEAELRPLVMDGADLDKVLNRMFGAEPGNAVEHPLFQGGIAHAHHVLREQIDNAIDRTVADRPEVDELRERIAAIFGETK